MPSVHAGRIAALRAAVAAQGLDGFLVPRSDEYLGEYVPACAERLAYISGFTGSAGFAAILPDQAAIWSDGRYTLQLDEQTDPAIWQRLHVTEAPPQDWLKANAAGLKLGYDPKLFAPDTLDRFSALTLVPVEANPLDATWNSRPAPPMSPAVPHALAHAGEPADEKRARIGRVLAEAGQDAAILTDSSSIAWLFNLRGSDVEFSPLPLGYAILKADGSATLFMADEKLPPETRAHLGQDVSIAAPESIGAALDALHGSKIRFDSAGMPAWFKQRLEAAGAIVVPGADPVALPRARKNAVEQDGARAAHLVDGLAVTRFLAWFANAAPTGRETEMSAAAQLLACRSQDGQFRGESFPAISGAGDHGAIIHYRVTPESDRAIRPDEVFLIDSGGQYLAGTTDITRTLWTGPGAAPDEIRGNVTRVLAGTIALAMVVFPSGVAGPHLDILARQALWQAGLDYDHGTGHGVGSYLSVHEGPASISRQAKPVPLEPGMILSDEPGYYLPGQYGIRMENLLLVQDAGLAATKPFLCFETLTLAPFDRALIEPSLLTQPARDWLNAYHHRVQAALAPLLTAPEDAATLIWLSKATAPL